MVTTGFGHFQAGDKRGFPFSSTFACATTNNRSFNCALLLNNQKLTFLRLHVAAVLTIALLRLRVSVSVERHISKQDMVKGESEVSEGRQKWKEKTITFFGKRVLMFS